MVDAARMALQSADPHQLSLRRVAALAGHGLGTLQYYFPKKAQLIEAVLGESYGRVAAAIETQKQRLEAGESLADVGADFVIEFYRVTREYRNISSVRMGSNLIAGKMSKSSFESLDSAVTQLQASTKMRVDARRLKLTLHSMSVLALRYAIHSPQELMQLLDVDCERDAFAEVEAHLAAFARAGIAQATRDVASSP